MLPTSWRQAWGVILLTARCLLACYHAQDADKDTQNTYVVTLHPGLCLLCQQAY